MIDKLIVMIKEASHSKGETLHEYNLKRIYLIVEGRSLNMNSHLMLLKKFCQVLI